MNSTLRPHQERAIAMLRHSLGKGNRRPMIQAPTPEEGVDLLDGEEWRPVLGYEGQYEVSNFGRVKSLPRSWDQKTRGGVIQTRRWPGRILKQTVDSGKYAYGRLQVKLCDGSGKGGQKTRLVHQLVAEAFIGPRPDGMEVAHRDGNPANNQVSNLRYATPLSNTNDKRAHGTILHGERAPNAKLTGAQVDELRSLRGQCTYQAAADKFGISISQAWRILNDQRWRAL